MKSGPEGPSSTEPLAATIRLLSDFDNAPEPVISGEILALEGSTMSLGVQELLEADQPLEIVSGNTMWLGEVRSCQQTGQTDLVRSGKRLRVQVELEYILRNLDQVARIAGRFGGSPDA